MIIYKDIIGKLKESGYTTYTLMKQGLIGQSTLTNIRNGKPISTATLDVICDLLGCQPGDVLEHVPNSKPKEEVVPE